MSLKPKHQRLVLALSALVALTGAVLLAMWGLKDRAAYFVTPTDIAAGAADEGEAVRLGGMVAQGSLRQLGDGVTLRFVVTDGKNEVPALFRGIPPSLFKEGGGVVAEGRLKKGVFVADNILAKHDERYMPPQLGNELAEQAAARTLER
ncbi:MAG TPA: cytochrome c maturation protein CcmE [Sphingomicrobium sp.]|nr:cytochrome c maturation protein CcmE [Sphingomicrobium sp.]